MHVARHISPSLAQRVFDERVHPGKHSAANATAQKGPRQSESGDSNARQADDAEVQRPTASVEVMIRAMKFPLREGEQSCRDCNNEELVPFSCKGRG
ncbi:MAG: hypothetical protein ACO3JL_12560, partial [Myxococcota bacterium]